GDGNGVADYATIAVSDASAVEIKVDGSVYTSGAQIPNENKKGSVYKTVRVRGKAADTRVNLSFAFFNDKGQMGKKRETDIIKIFDTNFKKDATLSNLTVARKTDPKDGTVYAPNLPPKFGEEIEFALTKDKFTYDLLVPYEACEEVSLQPFVNEENAKKNKLQISYSPASAGTALSVSDRDKFSVKLPDEGSQAQVKIIVTAEDTTKTETYTLNLTRSAKSNNANVKGVVLSEVGSKENLIKDFSPAVNEYKITLPYKTRILKLSAAAEFSEGRAKLLGDAVDKDGKPTENKLNLELNSQYVKLSHPLDKNPLFKADSAETVIIVRGISEEAQFIPPLNGGKD
ncbi:MAG: cadherin-like beta sandwich domain-containing protein, partial [Oscillospiraceae bacterium]